MLVLEVAEGRHRLEGCYRPPGLMPTALLSAAALFMAAFVFGQGLKADGGISVVQRRSRAETR